MRQQLSKGILSKEEQEKLLAQIAENTKVQAVKIKAEEAENLALTASKFGGIPYWNSKEKEYPTDTEGEKLWLLAQINCSEVPALSDFPQTGLLQFFVSGGDLTGLDFDNPISQKGWRVVYWENVDTSISKDDILSQNIPTTITADEDEEHYLPIYDGEYALTFTLTETSMGVHCYQFDSEMRKAGEELGLNIPEDKEWWEISDIGYDEEAENAGDELNSGHWIGGYPFFTQYDPRDENRFPDYTFLLLQMDTDGGIMWGDAGVGNFFITQEDLKNKDFSKVLYNWDCC